jgi:hypothetical protein
MFRRRTFLFAVASKWKRRDLCKTAMLTETKAPIGQSGIDQGQFAKARIVRLDMDRGTGERTYQAKGWLRSWLAFRLQQGRCRWCELLFQDAGVNNTR